MDWGSIIQDILDVGGNLLNNANKSRGRDKFQQGIRDAIEYDYNQQRDYNDAVNRYNQEYSQYEAGQSAAANAAANARYAASAATEANRQAAAKKAQKTMDKTYAQTMGMYLPYKQVADATLPKMSGAYNQSLENMAQLAGMIFTPEGIKKMNQSVPATSVKMPPPRYLRGV